MASDGSPLDFDATQRRRPPVDLTVPENACLVVLYGPHLGKRFPITERVRLGRGTDNDIVLPSPDVSRQHAELLQTGDGWIVRDLGSMNGTSVNGQEVPVEMRLFPNDLIDVGGVIFKLISGGNVEAQFYDEIYRLSVYDGLTMLHNRRYLLEFLERELSRSNRHQRPLSFAILDVDHFKQINDTYGHLAGDRLLTAFSALLLRNVRREELIGRWGGEEFAFILPETTLSGARIACEKLRELVEREEFSVGGCPIRITVSIGVAEHSPHETSDALIACADENLYRAKNGGRNRVCSELAREAEV